MIIGVPKEIKTLEHRVGLVPRSVQEFVDKGHEALVETGAGASINFTDMDYEQAGAKIIASPAEIFEKAEMIIKVKEPQPEECKMLRPDQILFTYLHLAADPDQAKALMDSRCVAIAYETVTGPNGKGLPLLQPMSEVAGRLSVQVGAYYLQKHMGGTGRMISGVTGASPAKVLIIGGGTAGFNAAQMATGLMANVTILEKSPERIAYLQDYFGDKAEVLESTEEKINELVKQSDLVIGAVLVAGASAPKLIRKDMLPSMMRGAVFVDIAIDQGGCAETSKATTHDKPTYVIDDVVHYCVANMPGAVALTSALALNRVVLPYALELANKGWKKALGDNPDFMHGLNVCDGKITHEAVAGALDLEYNPADKCLAA